MSAESPAPRPENWSDKYATAWQHDAAAEAYQYRPTYPLETFSKLSELIRDTPRRLLDLGCGTGGLARQMVPFADHIDAVDISAEMIARGKQLPNGDSPKLHWHVGRAEDIVSESPYALVTAGDSLHWMAWETLMPRLGSLLAPNARMAVLILDLLPLPWEDALLELLRTYSTLSTWTSGDLLGLLTGRDLFTIEGTYETPPYRTRQTIDAYIESFHARAACAHGRMTPAQSAAFDAALRQLIGARANNEIEIEISAKITWGIPHAPRVLG